MHIHGNSMQSHGTSFFTNSAAAKAAAALRAAENRKKLQTKAQTIAAETTPDESQLIGHWLDQQTDSYRTPDPLK